MRQIVMQRLQHSRKKMAILFMREGIRIQIVMHILGLVQLVYGWQNPVSIYRMEVIRK